jgi:phage-related protein
VGVLVDLAEQAVLVEPLHDGIAALVAAFVVLWNKSEAFRNFFINLWNGIKNTVTTIWNGIISIFTNAWYRIQSVWNGVSAFFSGKWQQIKNVFAGVVGWFGSVFANAWSAIKSKFSSWGSFWSGLWSSVRNKFSSIGSAVGNALSGAVRRGVNAVIGKVESVINGAISLINGAIALADKIVPGKLGRVKRVYLPRMAEGGIVDSATIAMIGEGKSSEAVIPLDELWKRLDKMAASIAGSGDGSPVVVNVYGAAGQNVNELAAAVAARLTALEKQKARAWA